MTHKDASDDDLANIRTKNIDDIFQQTETDGSNGQERDDIQARCLCQILPDVFSGNQKLAEFFNSRIDNKTREQSVDPDILLSDAGQTPQDLDDQVKKKDKKRNQKAFAQK
jgi:hypothetical protein